MRFSGCWKFSGTHSFTSNSILCTSSEHFLLARHRIIAKLLMPGPAAGDGTTGANPNSMEILFCLWMTLWRLTEASAGMSSDPLGGLPYAGTILCEGIIVCLAGWYVFKGTAIGFSANPAPGESRLFNCNRLPGNRRRRKPAGMLVPGLLGHIGNLL
jgi:hypothetical protein